MLGVVACAKAWRHFLLGAHCQVRVLTDHRSLQHVPLSKVAANRVGRWNMLLSEFQFEFSFIEGSKNHLADSLSRVVEIPPSAWTVVGEHDSNGIDVDNETFNFPIGRRPIDAFPLLGMLALQQLSNAEAQHYLLTTRTERVEDEFIEPTFFGFISQVSGDDDRYQSPEGDVSVRTDFDETLDVQDAQSKA